MCSSDLSSHKTSADGVLMDVFASVVIFRLVEYLAIVIPGLPDFERRREGVGEASTDALHGFRQVVCRDKEMDMVGHDDEGV